MSERPQANSSASSNGEDCADFEEMPAKELPLKEWFAGFTVVDV